jgi:DNA-binding transcriptional MerR regulator
MPNVLLIKDLSRTTGFSIYTLKFYLKTGLIKEVSRSPETRYRYFDETTVEKLKKIRSLRREGKSLREIKDELL